jgi:glycosyltransferase involved in cell wall biosynthesis
VRVFHRQARSLAEAGHAVTLLVHAPFAREERDGVELVGLRPPANRLQRLFSSWRFLRAALRQQADVYHFHDLELLPVGLILKIVRRTAVIYDCHENYPEAIQERAWLPSWIKPLLSGLVAWLEPALARHLDAVVCVVPDQEERLRRRGCRTVMVRNFPRLEIFAIPAAPAKNDEIVYLGGQSIPRGARMLVDIMAELKKSHPHVRLLCLGPFNEGHVQEEVRRYAAERRVDEIITYIPLVPHEQVAAHLYRARIGLVPWQAHPQLLKLCYPNKVFEYMACSLPIVASDLPGLRELIVPAASGLLVEPGEVGAHVAAIRRLLDHPDEARAMGEAGAVYARAHYAWEAERGVLLRLYARLGKSA